MPLESVQRRPSIPQEVRQQSNLGPGEETLFGVQPLEPFFLREQEYLTATDLIDSFDESPVRPAHDSSFKSYDVRGQFAAWPPCYFARECICSCPFSSRSHPSSGDVSAPAQEVARSRTLLEAHVRFGHRNFRSLAKALNLRLPAQLPFCKACVEAKATRHPKSRDPHPVRPVAVRAGARIYFDPFGPFRDRLADGSYYAILFMDAFSTVLWLNTISGLRDWFGCLERLISRLEAEKGSTKVVSELACDSAPMFKSSTQLQNYTDKKGIVLLFSPPYTQKFNVVERSIRTVGEMSLAMARHANTPKPFMCHALMLATRLLNRLHRTMPDGSVDVPLWRFKGVKVPLHLDRFHPFGCAVEAVLPKHSQTRFAPKTISCIFLGFDDNSLSYVLARLHGPRSFQQ